MYVTIGLAGVMLCSTGAIADRPAGADGRAEHIEQRFKSADVNKDGKLSLAEAEAGMPRIAKNFAKIDKDKKGYVTVEQVKEFAFAAE
jgi:Ca2+-binding EF-hand superfamily protein